MGVKSGMGSKYRERPLTEVYQDSDAMQRWLQAALSQLAPPVNVTPVTQLQLSPELQMQLEKAKQAGEEQK